MKKKPNLSFKKGNKKKILLFLLKFFGIFFLATLILEIIDLSFFTSVLASISSNLVGLEANANIVNVSGKNFFVSNSCTGLMSASILLALLFSLKKPSFEKKLVLFFVGLILILVLNIPRISLVLLSAKLGFDASLVHMLTWFIMSGLVLLIWFFGLKFFGVKDFSELI